MTARPRLAIVDPMCAAGYDPSHLVSGVLGGTEATVLRVSGALAGAFDITLFQRNRDVRGRCGALAFSPFDTALHPIDADIIVVINAWKVAIKLRRLNPDLPILLWLHVFPGRHNRAMGEALCNADVGVVCVSKSHADGLRRYLGNASFPDIKYIHNPVDDGLVPDGTPRQENRLLFASSPHKGLREVFERFDALRRTMPDLRLAVADPGYLRWDTGPAPENVVPLGVLSHAALIRQMRRSLCLFYPQTTFAETFGLVMAEANAVGTPVIAHRGLGATDEVLGDTGQCLDGTDLSQIAKRIARWRRQAPEITLDPMFRLSDVARQWMRVLHSAARCANTDDKKRVA